MIGRIGAVVATVAAGCWVGSTAFAETPLERGKYLVDTVMTCHNCHTPRGPNGPLFDKALSGGTVPFESPAFKVYAANITPDTETGIGSWSAEDLKKFLITGVRPNGVPVAPPMPTAFYKVLTPGDLDALATYLRSLPAVKNKVPEPSYKIALPPMVVPDAGAPMAQADMSDPVKRGFYLVTIAHCMECHTPLGPRGRDFTRIGRGGMEFEGPWGKSVSRNITSHKEHGLGAWTDEEIKRAVTQGVSRDGSRLKPPMGFAFYAKMAPGDVDAMVAYLRTVPPGE